MFKKTIATILAALMLLVTPLQTIAAADSRYIRGKNSYSFSEKDMLTSDEMDALVESVVSQNIDSDATAADGELHAVSFPVMYAPGDPPQMETVQNTDTTNIRLYPIAEREGKAIVFRGVFVGGDIAPTTENGDFTSFTYTFNDAAASTETLTAPGNYVHPNDSAFGYSLYSGTTDNWQSGSLFSSLSDDTLYQFEIRPVFGACFV